MKLKSNKGEEFSPVLIENLSVGNEWFSVKEAAGYFRITESAVRMMIYRGDLRFYKLGKRVRLKISDCQALFQKKGA